MKCEWVRENIVLQVYGELADDARHELEQHVARCADCAAELKAEQEFHALLAQDRAADPLLKIRHRICWRPRACGCRKRWRRPSRVASSAGWRSIRRTGCGR